MSFPTRRPDIELHNNEAEVGVLAGILRHGDAYFAINPMGLTAEDFMGRENRKVMAAIEAVVGDNREPDQALVLEEIVNASSVSEEYVSKLLVIACSIPQAFEHAKVVRGLSVARKLVVAGQAIIETARDARADYEEAMGRAESELRKVRDILPAGDRSPDTGDIIRRLHAKGAETGIPIKFLPSLQSVTGGFIPGHLWVVGGFSSVGKSAFAANVILDCLNDRRSVALISTEMTQENMMERMIAMVARIPFRSVHDRAYLGMEPLAAIGDAEDRLSRAPLKIFDTVYRLADIRLKATMLKEKEGLNVLIVDFLQNVRGSTGDFSFSDLTEITLELQEMAKDLRITVIALSQLSNEMAKHEIDGGDSNYYGFKGSGAIKDASDFAIMLRRDRISQSPSLTIALLKNRHGELRTIIADIDLPTGRIVELEPELISVS